VQAFDALSYQWEERVADFPLEHVEPVSVYPMELQKGDYCSYTIAAEPDTFLSEMAALEHILAKIVAELIVP